MNLHYFTSGIVAGFMLAKLIDFFLNLDFRKLLKLKPEDSNPLAAMQHMLVNVLGMSSSKVILSKNKRKLNIMYGYSCWIHFDSTDGKMALSIGVDNTTPQTEQDRQKELDELLEVIKQANFNVSNFTTALAALTTAINIAEREKFSHITRQLPPDML